MFTYHATRIVLKQGDITCETADAIVNAANSGLLGGGGVDGAIHRAGGPSLLEECQAIRAERGSCPAGRAVATGAGKLSAKYVIHAVGPVWKGGIANEASVLASSYETSLALASKLRCRSIAFPAISTGAYGYPLEEAAAVALGACFSFVADHPDCGIEEIRFVLFSPDVTRAFEQALAEEQAAA